MHLATFIKDEDMRIFVDTDLSRLEWKICISFLNWRGNVYFRSICNRSGYLEFFKTCIDFTSHLNVVPRIFGLTYLS